MCVWGGRVCGGRGIWAGWRGKFRFLNSLEGPFKSCGLPQEPSRLGSRISSRRLAGGVMLGVALCFVESQLGVTVKSSGF